MAKFNNAYFLIAELLFILDQATAKRRGGIVAWLASGGDGQPGLSGLEIFFIVIGALGVLISIVSCCLKYGNCDDEENQEAPAQLESVYSVQHGLDKSSNDQPLEVPPFAQPARPNLMNHPKWKHQIV